MSIIENIQKVVECKEQSGKIYIVVYPETDKTVVMGTFVNQYKQVINADMDLVKSVIDRASGEWECVGDTPIPYDINFDRFVEVKANPMAAYMIVTQAAVAKRPTVAVLKYRLKRSGVICGIKEDVLKKIVEEKLWDTEFVVAEGIKAVEGRDGGVKLNVSIEKSAKPQTREDGTVDYREISAFAVVKQGDAIATRIQSEPGVPGKDIYGKEIPVKPRKEFELKPSEGISVSPDGNNLVAEKTGVLICKSNGLLTIKEHLELGNVDFDTGNVKFPGKIFIKGSVSSGFTVESYSDIVINGAVDSATIRSTGGSVRIKGGISGKGNTMISAKKEVRVNFAQDTKIDCLEGRVLVESYLRHCEIVCKEFVTLKAEGSVIGGKIEATHSIEVANCSNEDETITELIIFDPVLKALSAKKIMWHDAIVQINRMYAPVEKDYKNKYTYVKALGSKPGSQEYIVYEAAKQKYEALKQKHDWIENNIKTVDEELAKVIESGKNCFITIANKGYGGTRIQFGKVVYNPKGEVYARRFYLNGAEVASVEHNQVFEDIPDETDPSENNVKPKPEN